MGSWRTIRALYVPSAKGAVHSTVEAAASGVSAGDSQGGQEAEAAGTGDSVTGAENFRGMAVQEVQTVLPRKPRGIWDNTAGTRWLFAQSGALLVQYRPGRVRFFPRRGARIAERGVGTSSAVAGRRSTRSINSPVASQ